MVAITAKNNEGPVTWPSVFIFFSYVPRYFLFTLNENVVARRFTINGTVVQFTIACGLCSRTLLKSCLIFLSDEAI
jgi:hypothetical protein